MFISLSKVMKLGGSRLGFGLRITKKNSLWMSFIVMFVCILQAMWYMMLLGFWLMYVMMYGMIWCIVKLTKAFFGGLSKLLTKLQNKKGGA